MDFTNYMFVVALVFILMSGSFIFWNDTTFRNGYTPTITKGLNQTLINQSFYEMDNVSHQALVQAGQNSGDSNNLLNAALGYLAGALGALKIMLMIPDTMLKMLNAVGLGMGIFMPTYILSAVIFGVYAVALIGALYYLMKVK